MLEQGQPEGPRRVLVTGGGGYIGCVLVNRLLERGHRVRVFDRLDWGQNPLRSVAERIELVEGDIRDARSVAAALEDVDGVVALAGLSNDATAEHDPEANWQMNALATETLGRMCERRGVARVVFASSCSLYDGLGPGPHDEDSAVIPRGPYAIAKRYGEEALLGMASEDFCPVILRNGTAFGWSPRMRFDLVVNTFVMAALLDGRLTLHGGGRMRRPLVEVRDIADATILALEAPADSVRGEIFNVLHGNQRIRDLAELVADAASALGHSVELEDAPDPGPARDYECSNRKLEARLGFLPGRSAADAVQDLLTRMATWNRESLSDPRYRNLPWLAGQRSSLT